MKKVKGTKIKLQFVIPEENTAQKKKIMAAFRALMRALGFMKAKIKS